ncbi:MAG: hypothetical protein IJF03_00815 [Lachnospiraceae bacterium]|nr:hypothetical protein [Lachnospiraceae bacterium]
MNKKAKKAKLIIPITIVVMIVALVICTYLSRGRNVATKYETDIYTVSVSKQWDIETPFDNCRKFMVGSNEAAYIEIFRDCTYCTSAESIAMNVFGEHSSLRDVEETVLGDWTRYKMVIDYELSASQEIQGENPPEEETHYIYTNKQDMFIDVYANNQLLTEEEIQKFIDSFKLK